MVHPQVADGGMVSNRRVAANILNRQLQTAKGWSSSLGVGKGAKQLLTIRTGLVTKWIHLPQSWTDSDVLKQLKHE